MTSTLEKSAKNLNSTDLISKQTTKIKDKAAATVAELASLFSSNPDTTSSTNTTPTVVSATNGTTSKHEQISKSDNRETTPQANGNQQVPDQSSSESLKTNGNNTLSSGQSDTIHIETLSSMVIDQNETIKNAQLSEPTAHETVLTTQPTTKSSSKSVKSPTKHVSTTSLNANLINSMTNSVHLPVNGSSSSAATSPAAAALFNLNSTSYLNDLLFNQQQSQSSNYSNTNYLMRRERSLDRAPLTDNFIESFFFTPTASSSTSSSTANTMRRSLMTNNNNTNQQQQQQFNNYLTTLSGLSNNTNNLASSSSTSTSASLTNTSSNKSTTRQHHRSNSILNTNSITSNNPLTTNYGAGVLLNGNGLRSSARTLSSTSFSSSSPQNTNYIQREPSAGSIKSLNNQANFLDVNYIKFV